MALALWFQRNRKSQGSLTNVYCWVLRGVWDLFTSDRCKQNPKHEVGWQNHNRPRTEVSLPPFRPHSGERVHHSVTLSLNQDFHWSGSVLLVHSENMGQPFYTSGMEHFSTLSASALPHLHACSFHWLSTHSESHHDSLTEISEWLTTYIYSLLLLQISPPCHRLYSHELYYYGWMIFELHCMLMAIHSHNIFTYSIKYHKWHIRTV